MWHKVYGPVLLAMLNSSASFVQTQNPSVLHLLESIQDHSVGLH